MTRTVIRTWATVTARRASKRATNAPNKAHTPRAAGRGARVAYVWGRVPCLGPKRDLRAARHGPDTCTLSGAHRRTATWDRTLLTRRKRA